MKKYIKPEVIVETITLEDVIMASPVNEGTGGFVPWDQNDISF